MPMEPILSLHYVAEMPLLLRYTPLKRSNLLPSEQVKNKLIFECMNVQGCNDPAKREYVGRLFVQRGLDVLV